MKILSFRDIFDTDSKVIIGMVHLKPLPGAPLWNGDFNSLIDRAIKDAKNLEEGGVHGIIVENYGDKPFLPRVKAPETISAMAIVVNEIRKEVSIPVGVNLLRNSAIEAAAIAYVCGAKFIRVNVFVETIYTDSGIIRPIAPSLLRYINKIRAEIGIFADINVKHGVPIAKRNLEDIVLDAFERGLASCVILTGKRTGKPPEIETLKQIYESKFGPVLIGSGLRVDNIDILKYADGAIVGTYFKEHGKTENGVDIERVKKFISALKSKFLI